MTYRPDANELAKQWERQQARTNDSEGTRTTRPVGTLVLKDRIRDTHTIKAWNNVMVDLDRPGLVVIHSLSDASTEFLKPEDGWTFRFEPDREGE